MRVAEMVTFGGSDLERAASERRDATRLSAELTAGAGVIVLWRGKPLVQGDPAQGRCALVRVQQGDRLLDAAGQPPIFLGRIAGAAVFAQDISAWAPTEPVDEAQIGAFLDPTIQRHWSIGIKATAFAPSAARPRHRPKPVGSAIARPAAPIISRAPTLWSSC
jgi:NAD+ diphosphatase